MAAQQIIFGSLDTTDFDDDQNKLLSAIQAVDNTNIEIGATLNASNAMQELAKLMITQGKTVAQMQETFNTLGWYPKMKKVKVKTGSQVSKEGYVETADGQQVYVGSGTTISSEQEVLVFEGTEGISDLTNANLGSTITATYAPKHNTLPLPSSKGGGGKSKKELKVLDEEIERYHQISELLDDLNRQYDELSERKDRAFGASHLSYLEAEKEQLDEIIQAQKDYVSEIEGYLATDKEALLQYGASLDEEGRITNYEELMRVNVESYNKAAEKFNAGQMSEEQFAEYEKAWSL